MNKCPRCGHEVEWLATEYVCQDCGIEYDANTTVIKLRLRKESRAAFRGMLLTTLSLSLFLFKKGYWLWGVSVLVVGGGLLISMGRNVVQAYSDGDGVLVINDAGIAIEHPEFENMHIEWSMIGRARFNCWTDRFTLIDKQGEKVLALNCSELGGQGSAHKCAAKINRCIEERAAIQ